MSTFVIGDLQACHAQLHQLLDRLRDLDPVARFIFVGDIVNRGPASLATLRTVKGLNYGNFMVLGNHDLNLLAVAHNLRESQAGDTLDDILAAPDREELLDWLRHQPLALEAEGHLVVHAGVLQPWSMEKTLELAREVEVVLRGPGWLDFLANMYGSQPARWDDSLAGYERLRCIVNALTRMRYCLADGSMDFAKQPHAGQIPWFELPDRAAAGVNIIYGHWSALGLTLRERTMGLDTGCIWGGKLTALRLADRAVFQVDCPQFQKPAGE